MRRKTLLLNLTLLCSILLLGVSLASAQEMQVSKEQLTDLYKGKAYSPYAQRTFPERPLWGDSHLHTSLSFDAGAFGNRLDPRAAYRFARGEEITATSGQPARLSRPLDWLAITDHSDGMGFTNDALDGSPFVTNYEQGARWAKGFRLGGQDAHGHRQVKGRTFFLHVRRCQVDGHFLGGENEAAVPDGRLHAFLGFAHRAIRQPHGIETGNLGWDVRLDFDDVRVDAEHGGGEDPCEHTVSEGLASTPDSNHKLALALFQRSAGPRGRTDRSSPRHKTALT